jgi:uncharacterized repeat protein (TIGR01451 family)
MSKDGFELGGKTRRSRHRGRSGLFLRGGRTRAAFAAALSLAIGLSGLSAFALSTASTPSAEAAPGTPGTPQANTTVFEEGFENGTGATPVVLTDYTGANGEKYTAANVWLTNCNGQIRNFNTPYTNLGNCVNTTDSSNIGQLAYALGANAGSATPAANHAVTAYTEGNPGANAVEFQTVDNIPLASASGRFLTFSVDTAAVNCAVSAPLYQFAFLNESGTATNVGGVINACTSTKTVDVPAYGTLGARAVNVGTYTSNGSVLFNGSALGVRMTNANGSGVGNDAAFDNIRILDVTPQLDKAFSPASVAPGQASTLTFTITNTAELAAKNGWSFSDTLPAGLTIANPAAASTTCPAGTVTAAAGATTITAGGNLNAGMASCTVTVNVTGVSAGSYTNGPDNVTETGLNEPGPTTLTIAPPVVTCTTDANVFNTGYNAATGGILPDNSKDANWQVAGRYPVSTGVSLPPADATWAPANVGNMAPGSWTASPYGNAQWISQQTIASPSQGSVSGDWYYRYQFSLDGSVDPAAFALSMNFLADNTVAEVYVNGAAQSGKTTGLPQFPLGPDNGPGSAPYFSAGFLATSAAQTTLSNDWQTGLNTIVVQIKSGPGAEGFDAQVRPSVLCPQPAYTVAKTASAASVQEGGTIDYMVTVTNTGNVDYTAENPASITDDLTKVLDDATYNGDAAVAYSGSSTSDAPAVTGSTLAWSGPLAVGETATITYSVTVRTPDNGDHSLINAVTPGEGGACDPAGTCTIDTPVQSYSVTKTANSTDVVPGDTITYTLTVHNTGQAPYTAANPAALTDDLSDVLDDATYNNDASSGATYAGSVLSWSGALAIDETVTITYSVTVNDPATGDQHLGNAVVTTNGGDCPAGTDNPACRADIPSGSFSVEKLASSTVANPGETITYTVTVRNTGEVAYTTDDPAAFKDDLSAVLDDATYNDDASNGATITGETLSWSGALPVDGTVTITYSVTVDSPDAGDKSLRNAVRPTGPGGTCVDGACSTVTAVRSLTVDKISSAPGVVHPGDAITYTINVHNNGQGDYTDAVPASFTDDLSGVLDDASYNGDATNGATVTGETLSWSGPLAAGQSLTITYSVKVNAPGDGDGELRNAVTGTVPGSTCATPGGCETLNELQAYSLSKTSDPTGNVVAGQTVTYTITVTATGTVDYTASDPASFTDDLSAVLDDAAYNGDATNGATLTGDTLAWSGAVAVGTPVTISYSVTVGAVGTGDGELTNAVVPDGPGGACADGACSTTNLLKAFTLEKVPSSTVANPGDVITYTITASNTGAADYTDAEPATFDDDLSGVLDDADYNEDATNGAVLSGKVLSWALAIPAGQSVSVTYSVTVNAPDTGDKHLRNAVTPTDPSGSCAADGACTTDTPTRSYHVTKSVSSDSSAPGKTLTYTITVKNTGEADYTDADPATFTDDLSKVLDDAVYNGDATGGATYERPVLSWSGALAMGASTTVTYSITVDSPDKGDRVISNAVVTGAGGNCVAGSDDSDCSVTTKVVVPTPPLADTGTAAWVTTAGIGALLAILAGLGAVFIRRRRTAE